MGHKDLFDYCVKRLGYSEGAASKRVHAAWAADLYHSLYVLIRDGALTLSTVARLKPHLTPENFDSVVARASRKSYREVEALIVELIEERRRREAESQPGDAEPVSENALFESVPGIERASPPIVQSPVAKRRPDTVRLESPGVVRVSFQADESLRRALDRLKDLLRHSCPGGRLEDVLSRVADDYLARHDPLRRSTPAAARPRRARETRRVPRWVRDRVWARDQGRCAFVGEGGRRCEATGGLELDHVVPWANGGTSDDPANVRLLCRAHNLFKARRDFARS